MNKTQKIIIIVFLLLLLTALCIITPALADIIRFERTLDKKEYWTYDIQSECGLTSEEVVEYYNNSLTDVPSEMTATITELTQKMLKKAFLRLLILLLAVMNTSKQ